MNNFKGLLPLSGCSLLVAVALVGFVAAGDLHADLAKLADNDGEESPFDEDQVGYDKHADIFYYQDKTVNIEYERKNFMATRVTLAGQRPDVTMRAVKAAVNPFGVAQRTFKNFKTMMDRWDVKDTGRESQYFALFHGRDNPYVVNKVRAHLLRTLANALNDYLPSLDRIAESDASDEDPDVQTLLDNIRGTIERVFREVDATIRKTMADSDDSSASATVAIVSKTHVITASVGAGKVIAYDQNCAVQNLTPFEDDKELKNLFGVKKSRKEYIHPHVEFYSREANGFQFLLLETPAVAANLDDEAVSRIVLTEIEQHKYEEDEEQEIYAGSLVRILNSLENSLSFLERFVAHSDYSIALVGLNTNYQDIH